MKVPQDGSSIPIKSLLITSITVLSNDQGTDSVILTLDLPNGCYPYTGQATAEIKVANNKGQEYVRNNFGEDTSFRVIKLGH